MCVAVAVVTSAFVFSVRLKHSIFHDLLTEMWLLLGACCGCCCGCPRLSLRLLLGAFTPESLQMPRVQGVADDCRASRDVIVVNAASATCYSDSSVTSWSYASVRAR